MERHLAMERNGVLVHATPPTPGKWGGRWKKPRTRGLTSCGSRMGKSVDENELADRWGQSRVWG